VVGPVLAILIPTVLARPPKPGEAEPAPKPPWQRLLQGDDAKRAKDLDKAIETALKADQWDKAIARAEELVALRSRVQGSKHDETATDEWRLKALRRVASMSQKDRFAYQSAISMNEEAETLMNQGKYAEAQLPCAQALEIRQRLFADDSPSTAESECNLATTLSAQGKYAQADERHERALKIDRRLFGGDHTQIAVICNNLATNLDAWGRFFEAQPKYEEALRISQGILGDDSILTATCYSNLAANLNAQKKYAKAQPLAKKALEINRRLFTDDHTSTALSYSYLAYNLTAQGKYTEAQPLCEKALEIFRRHLTENHNRTSECYTLLAIILASQGKYDAARDRWRSAVKSQAAARLQVAFTGLERAGALRSPGAALAAVEARLKNPDAAWQALEEDFGRGLLDELAARDHGLPVGRVAGLDAIQAALPAEAALIAWVDIPPTGPNAHDPDGEHWGVVVRSRGMPSWIPITGTGPDGLWTEDDAALVYRVRTELQRRPEDGPASPGPLIEKLRTQRLTPLAEALGDTANGLPTVQRLIVLPSRGMMGIPIEALLANDDPRTVSYAPSATVFKYLRDQPKPDRNAGLLALGDPNYAVARSGNVGFDPLPSSRAEVLAIAQLFRSRDRDADCLLGPHASEPKLNGLAISGKLGQFGVIHLATHAVIDEDIPARSAAILTQTGLPDPPQQADNNKPGFDGRVSVLEIQRSWYLKADLVTFSACETALGRDAGGEGFVGFTQVLLLSGARSVCLSLWKVDDRATSLLMTRFYQNWLGARPGGDRMPKAEALREAKKWLRGSTREEATHAMEQISRGSVRNKAMAPAIPPPAHPYEHPYYWAGFILVGDPD
jgi:CHAT domain-containing protein/tetratricopeptide (TPR) repeat protein